MNTATITETGTYKGRTAEQWRAESREMFAKREESYQRSDTDGFLSQWALGSLSQQYSLCAQLAEANGLTETRALFDLDGNLVPSIHGHGEYGEYFAVLDNDERGCRRFFNPSKARNDQIARRNDAAKGFYVGLVKVAGKVELLGSGKGLSGCASAYNAIIPARGEISTETVVEIIDNGQAVEQVAPVEVVTAPPAGRVRIYEALVKAAESARTNAAKDTLSCAAELVRSFRDDEARELLAPMRTRASRTAIAALKAL
jgi:hypothetical protein